MSVVMGEVAGGCYSARGCGGCGCGGVSVRGSTVATTIPVGVWVWVVMVLTIQVVLSHVKVSPSVRCRGGVVGVVGSLSRRCMWVGVVSVTMATALPRR